MDSPGQGFENLAQRRRQESAEDNIVPLPSYTYPLPENTAGAGDAEWLRFNLLSLGFSACV